jgi:predicted nucleic acid-binding Zn finger protein
MYSAKLGRDNEKMFFGPMKTKFKSLVKIGGKNQAIVDCAICTCRELWSSFFEAGVKDIVRVKGKVRKL